MDDEPLAAKRAFNTTLEFWIACPTPRCRRYRRCAGDADRCRAIFWPEVPDDVKTWWGAFKQAHRDGHSAEQAAGLAGAAVERWREWVAQRKARDASGRGG